MNRIVSHAIAKVNLSLNITGKYQNGYHRMQSIFAFLDDVYDEITLYTDQNFEESSVAIQEIENNSIINAWKILKNNFERKMPHKIPYIELKKNIPICGGLGGGSSDSACFVNSVFDFWEFSKAEKLKYIDLFIPLGADAMVFLYKYFSQCRFVYINGTGIEGELEGIDLQLKNWQLKNKYILIVNDGTKLSTKKVFENFKEPYCHEIENHYKLETFHNSLQNSALELAPNLKNILNDLSLISRFYGISGSGSTCFAIVDNCNHKEISKKYKYARYSQF